jgi:Domain of unknown function (DUF4380)
MPTAARTLSRRCGPTEVEFLPSEGGRLTRLRYNGVDLVLPPGRVPGFHGDTFWPSPQSRFDWPPPPVLDAGPYEILTESPLSLALRSAPDPDFGLQVEKRFDLSEHGLRMEFTLTNIWPNAQAVAPWQVTRAPRTGILVWASGQPFHDDDRIQKQAEDPGCWFLHEATAAFEGLHAGGTHSCIPVRAVTRKSKFFTDARGWLAHAHEGTLFLRIFPDLTLDQAAPRQAEVEMFFDPGRDYIELENQGAHVTLAPGQSLTYPVEWRFHALPPGLETDRITPALLAEIHSLLEPRDARLGTPT